MAEKCCKKNVLNLINNNLLRLANLSCDLIYKNVVMIMLHVCSSAQHIMMTEVDPRALRVKHVKRLIKTTLVMLGDARVEVSALK